MDRRQFLRTSIAGAGVIVGASLGGLRARAAATQEKTEGKAMLKLCSQDGLIPGKSPKEKAENLLKWGAVGIEFWAMDAARARQLKKELAGTGIAFAALCWGSGNGNLVSTDLEKRKRGVADLKAVLDVAGELASPGVIFVPTFNGQSNLAPDEITKILLDVLPELGEHAVKAKTRVLLEPLNRGETFYLNRLEQAVDICKKVASPGVALMGDFYHMAIEEKDDEAAFAAAKGLAHHVHLASRARNLPGQDDRSFIAGFRGLKKIGYRDYCSLECSIKGDPMVEIPKSFALLKRQWEEAKV
jgi:sugar phosphate isomerase/epimerase